MTRKPSLLELIRSKRFMKEGISAYTSCAGNNSYKDVILLFDYIIESKYITKDSVFICNAINTICLLCENCEFKPEEVETIRQKIKKARTHLLKYLRHKDNEDIRTACNKLDVIVLNKSVGDNELIQLIKHMINLSEDTAAIKKILKINRACITNKNNNLFDYVFNKLINETNECKKLYYITLLKIFYFSELNKDKYLKMLDCSNIKKHANELYEIIMGNKRFLSTEQIVNKYDKKEVLLTGKTSFKRRNLDNNGRIITIDGLKCALRDDAISITKDGNKYIVGIYITDVGSAINYNSVLDVTARNLYKDSYLEDRKIEIFPKRTGLNLSLLKCSRKESITLYVVLNDSGDVLDYYIKNNDIIIAENLSYFDTDDILDNKRSSAFKKDLEALFMFASILRQKSHEKEKYWKEKDSSKIYSRMYNTKSHLLVGEFAILYNKLIAKEASEKEIPFIYRAQDKSYLPDLVSDLNISLNNTSQELVNSIFLEGYYTDTPAYHHGLNEEVYSQCSSPLRRYTDIYNQYLLHKFYFKNKDFDSSEFEQMISYLNERELETRLFEEEYNREAMLLKRKGPIHF